jgi:hypothetical protein
VEECNKVELPRGAVVKQPWKMKSLPSAGKRDKKEKRRKEDKGTKRRRKRKTGENRGITNRFMEGGEGEYAGQARALKKVALESETNITAWGRGKESVVLKRTVR